MFKNGKVQYVIKTVPSESTLPLQNLLNEMAEDGWELYSMQEIEADEGFQFNCIFVKNIEENNDNSYDDVVNIAAFKSQMEKMLSAKLSPYESCREIQAKIREQKKKVSKVKAQLESEDAGSTQRKHLNDKMSAGLKELENLQHKLIKAISPDAMFSNLQSEKFSIHLNEEILQFVSPDNETDLLSETVKIRQKLTDELGYVIPKIVFQDDELLAPYEFSINIRGLSVFNSFVYPNYVMFYQDDLNMKVSKKSQYSSIDQITGKKTIWIEESKTKNFWQKGLTPSEYIAKAVEFVSIKYIEELMDYQDINKYIDIVNEENAYLVETIIPDFMSMAELRYTLINLVKERVSIKDIVYIFEKINDFADESCKEDLLDKIRFSLSRFICCKYSDEYGNIQGFALSDESLNSIFDNAEDEDNIVRIDGQKVEKLADKIMKLTKKNELEKTILLVPMEIRHMTFIVLSQYIPDLAVLAVEELTNNSYSFDVIEVI